MEPKKVYTKWNPKEKAGPLSTLFFGWAWELLLKSRTTELELTDLYFPTRDNESERLLNRLNKSWERELTKLTHEDTAGTETDEGKSKEKIGPSLRSALLRTFRKEFVYTGALCVIIFVVLRPLIAYMQSFVIRYFDRDEGGMALSKREVLTYAAVMVSLTFLVCFLVHHATQLQAQLAMRLRIACSALIYKKILRLSKSAFTQTTCGQVVNLLSNDIQRFDRFCECVHFIWVSPLQMIVIGSVMWTRISYVTLISIGTLIIVSAPIHCITVKMMKGLRQVIAELTDERVQLMQELITGMQVIKMYAWEKPFSKIITAVRTTEILKIRRSSYIQAIYLANVVLTSRFVLYSTVVYIALAGNGLRSDVTFTLSAYFEMLQLTVAFFFPLGLISFSECMVSIDRIQKFLLLEEQSGQTSQVQAIQDGKNGQKTNYKRANESIELKNGRQTALVTRIDDITPVSVTLDRVYANWIPKHLPPTISGISMQIRSGELFAIVGCVGSGKSSILHLLLREIPLGAGNVRVYSGPAEKLDNTAQGFIVDSPNLTISYASQEPWLFSGTVRENILFGLQYDNERYVAVTKACALTKDFQNLPHGDMSSVGENGSALSGGQKARVNLARAVYKKADIYLLDDPLSAVDAKVAKHLFHKCIQQYLRGKTRVLVTHQLQFLEQTDSIAVLDRGMVKMQGSYNELSKFSKKFVGVIEDIKMSVEATKQRESIDTHLSPLPTDRRVSQRSTGRASVASVASSRMSYEYDAEDYELAEDNELSSTKRFSGSVFKKYFKYGVSYVLLAVLALIIIFSQMLVSSNDIWLSYWTNMESARRSLNSNGSRSSYDNFPHNNAFWGNIFTLDSNGLLTTIDSVYLYTFFILMCIVFVFSRNFFFVWVCSKSSQNLHDTMFWNVLRTSLSFFHRNQSGRIFNRFTKDVGNIDEMLPATMLESVQVMLVLTGCVIVIMICNYWMVIPLAILGAIFLFLWMNASNAMTRLKQLESVAKSPVFAHVNATIEGLSTIKTCGPNVAKLLENQFHHLQDIHSGAWYMLISIMSTTSLYIDILVSVFYTCLAFSFILIDSETVLSGHVGLALTQASIILGTLPHGLKRINRLLAYMTSVSRLLEYTELPSEGDWHSSNPPPPTWPQRGHLTLRNVNLRYEQDQPTILKDLNVTLEAGWKVGVVGRTGAGKSSLISVLFRLFPEGLQGKIEIDGIDVNTLGLHELRSKMSIIPQQPFLFSNSVRNNLDPFNSYDDAKLWDSLHQVELSHLFLDHKIEHSGSNLSIGQRQLICLARAVLKNNRILVLDEATANIDNETDSLIQKTIRTRFADCTVITVAHRLNTIIDCDRIIVMDAGRIEEFGSAHELLRNNPNGIFSQMVENTGPAMAQMLRKQAEEARKKNTLSPTLESGEQSSSDNDTEIIAQTSL
ncbi:ATP-binding cassette sub-family C member 4 [Halictus rubicundus]|uniref:ATP-binding cassette sub-family C member 4 n=1 Tax=Halictus rubicundus TaxID=77578 RepID=UPI0040372E87